VSADGAQQVPRRLLAGDNTSASFEGVVAKATGEAFTPSGNSQYQADAYHMLQFCRIRIEVVQNDFLR
jgi:hypothetical protein